jgi:hypothetical protein
MASAAAAAAAALIEVGDELLLPAMLPAPDAGALAPPPSMPLTDRAGVPAAGAAVLAPLFHPNSREIEPDRLTRVPAVAAAAAVVTVTVVATAGAAGGLTGAALALASAAGAPLAKRLV